MKRAALNDAILNVGDPLREALGGLLKPAVLEATANAGDGSLYVVLYELNDRELLSALEHLEERAHVILANGSCDPEKKPDENKAARDEYAGRPSTCSIGWWRRATFRRPVRLRG